MTLAERLVKIREANGYTRKRLAEELGKPYRTITNYENGEREPGHDYIIAIAQKFGVSTDYILGLSDTPTGKEKAPSETDETEIKRKLTDMFNKLPPDSQEQVLSYMRFLASDSNKEADK